MIGNITGSVVGLIGRFLNLARVQATPQPPKIPDFIIDDIKYGVRAGREDVFVYPSTPLHHPNPILSLLSPAKPGESKFTKEPAWYRFDAEYVYSNMDPKSREEEYIRNVFVNGLRSALIFEKREYGIFSIDKYPYKFAIAGAKVEGDIRKLHPIEVFFVRYAVLGHLRKVFGNNYDPNRVLGLLVDALFAGADSMLDSTDIIRIYAIIISLIRSGHSAKMAYQRTSALMDPWGHRLIQYIKQEGKVRFDRFFELAMYDPEIGIYTSRNPNDVIGVGGEFTTYAETKAFATLIAEHVFAKWVEMGRPERFDIVEMGAGTGRFAKNLLDYIRRKGWDSGGIWTEFARAVKYTIVERSPSFVAAEKELLSGYDVMFINASAVDFRLPEPIVGVFFSNELLDMFSPRRFVFKGGRWYETYVGVGEFGEVKELLEPVVGKDLFTVHGLRQKASEGAVVYYQPAVRFWLRNLSAQLKKGLILTVDYGSLEEGESRSLIVNTRRVRLSGFETDIRRLLEPIKFSWKSLLLPKDFSVEIDIGYIIRQARSLGLKTRYSGTQMKFFYSILKRLGMGAIDKRDKYILDVPNTFKVLELER